MWGKVSNNGVLKRFDEPLPDSDTLESAQISCDGRLLGILTEDKDFIVLAVEEDYNEVVLKNIKEYLWSKQHKESLITSQFPEVTYLVALDEDDNILIYSLQKKNKATKIGYQAALVTLISACTFDFEEGSPSKVISLISASYNDFTTEHKIICLLGYCQLVVIQFVDGTVPIVTANVSLPLDSAGTNKSVKAKENLGKLVVASTAGYTYFVDLETKEIIHGVSLNRNFNEQDSSDSDHDGAGGGLLDISDSLECILFVDQQCNLQLVRASTGEIFSAETLDFAFQRHSSKDPDELIPEVHSRTGDAGDNMWKFELEEMYDHLRETDTLESEQELMNKRTRDSRFGDLSTHVDQSVKIKNIDPPEGLEGFYVDDIAVGDTSVLLVLKCKTLRKDPYASRDSETVPESLLILVEYETEEFKVQSLEKDASLAKSSSAYFPHCVVTKSSLYIPTFELSQEQLVSSIIQYAGIAEAEKICRSNSWNQFSIPLHTLEIGLQHRQTDTIAFFLKTRERAFSKYWKNLLVPTSPPSVTDKMSPSPSSLKSFLLKSSMSERLLDPSELQTAIEMLVKGVHASSKGKHKRNFFESLLRMTLDFLNALIRDGVEAGESLNIDWTTQRRNGSETKELCFLEDIHQSLMYLNEQIITVRQYLKDLPSTGAASEPVNEFELDPSPYSLRKVPVSKDFKTTLEDFILDGKLGYAQSLLLQQDAKKIRNINDCSFSSLQLLGLHFAYRTLQHGDTDNCICILRNMGFQENEVLKSIFTNTLDRNLREFLNAELKRLTSIESLTVKNEEDYKYLKELEILYPCEDFDLALSLKSNGWTADDVFSMDSEDDAKCLRCLKSGALRKKPQPSTLVGHYSELMLRWIQNWNRSIRAQVLLDASFQGKTTDLGAASDSDTALKFLLSHNAHELLLRWLRSEAFARHSKTGIHHFPQFKVDLAKDLKLTIKPIKESICREIARLNMFTKRQLEEFPDILKYLSQTMRLFDADFSSSSTLPHDFIHSVHSTFINFCLKNNLRDLLYAYLDHHKAHAAR